MDANINAMLESAGYPTEEAPAEAPQAVEEVAEEVTAEDAAEEAEGEGGEGEAKPEEKPAEPEKPWKKGPPQHVPYDEFSRARAERREALERAQALEEELSRYRTGALQQVDPRQVQTPQGLPPKPRMEDFDAFEKYEEAKDAWLVTTARAQAIAEIQQATTARSEEMRVQQAVSSFQSKLSEAYKVDPEIGEIQNYLQPIWPSLHPMVQAAIVEDDDPAASLRALAQLAPSLQEVQALARQSPAKAIAMIGRLSASTQSTRPAATARQAPAAPQPPPMRTVSTQSAPKPRRAPGDMTTDQIMEEFGKHLRR